VNFPGTILKTLFGNATISDIYLLRNILDELQSWNSDIVHFYPTKKLTKKLGATTEINANAIANLSNVIKNMIQSRDKFQQIERDMYNMA
jgi:hypothetical protein